MIHIQGRPALTLGRMSAIFVSVLSAFVLLALATGAQAQSMPTPLETAALFGTEYGDAYTSIFLNQLFGPLFPAASGSSTTTVFSSIIGYFNVIILVIGGLLMVHNISVGLLQSAFEGKVLGQRWSALWAPLRVVFAVGLLVPISGMGGYNVNQAVVAYIVRGSTNIASAVWGTSAELVINYSTPITAAPGQIDPNLVETLFENAACQAIVAQQYAIAGGTATITNVADTLENGTRTRVGTAIRDANGNEVSRNICGSYTTPSLPRYITSIDDDGSIAGIPGSARENITTSFQNAHINAMQTLMNGRGSVEGLVSIAGSLLPMAMDNGQSPADVSSRIATVWNAANAELNSGITQIMNLAVGADRQAQASRDALLARIQGSCAAGTSASATNPDTPVCYGEGWIGAGSWYMMLAQLNNEIASLTAATSEAARGTYITAVDDASRQIYLESGGRYGLFGFGATDRAHDAGLASQEEATLWMARMIESYRLSTVGLAALGFPMAPEVLLDLNGAIVGTDGNAFLSRIPGLRSTTDTFMRGIMDYVSPTSFGSDPMVGLSGIGYELISAAGVLMVGVGVVGIVAGAGIAVLLLPIIAPILVAGATLAFILPIMPFIFWILAVTGYFLLIIEAVIAVNLWALAHMRMDGEGISGEAGRMGWLMLLSLLMTPVLMVIGFLIGMSIFRITSALINLGIHQALSGIIGGGIFVEVVAMVFFPLLMIIIYVIILERSFSLVSEFPGRVLRWMNADANISSGDENRGRMMAAAGAAAVAKVGSAPGGAVAKATGAFGVSSSGAGARDRDGDKVAGYLRQKTRRYSRSTKSADGGGQSKPTERG